MVVSMRPVPPPLVATAEEVTARFPRMHGRPIHVGDPDDIGIAAIKIEGRQRSPRYVADVVGVLRAAIDDACRDPKRFAPRQEWQATLGRHAEGDQVTQGAYERPWR